MGDLYRRLMGASQFALALCQLLAAPNAVAQEDQLPSRGELRHFLLDTGVTLGEAEEHFGVHFLHLTSIAGVEDRRYETIGYLWPTCVTMHAVARGTAAQHGFFVDLIVNRLRLRLANDMSFLPLCDSEVRFGASPAVDFMEVSLRVWTEGQDQVAWHVKLSTFVAARAHEERVGEPIHSTYRRPYEHEILGYASRTSLAPAVNAAIEEAVRGLAIDYLNFIE